MKMNCRSAIAEIIFRDQLDSKQVHILSLTERLQSAELWVLKPDFATHRLLILDGLLSIPEPLFPRKDRYINWEEIVLRTK